MIFEGFKKSEFYSYFQTEEDCMGYLGELKWSEGYSCRKCSCQDSMPGKRPFSRRCKSCKYDESATSHTLFHKLKFSIRAAFDMAFQICTQKKGVSSLSLSEEVGVHYETALNFRRRLQKAMESSCSHPLDGKVEVDEFAVGGYDAEAQGRAKGDKKLVSVALQITACGKFGRAYAMKIADYSSRELRRIFDAHISQDALVRTDKWTGYLPIKATYQKLEQEYSEKGRNFQQMHIHIMNIKSWIRGTMHHVSDEYIQRYLDEFHFRFNRRGFRRSIFHKIIQKVVQSPPVLHSTLKTKAT
jgi:hypothetical protein